jgi:hypothetical protein
MVGPLDGVNAVEMTLATHPDPAAALRASETLTTPSAPLIVPPLTVLARVPRLPAETGTVIARVPPVIVNVAGVVSAAAAGRAVETASGVNARAASRWRVFMTGPSISGSGARSRV